MPSPLKTMFIAKHFISTSLKRWFLKGIWTDIQKKNVGWNLGLIRIIVEVSFCHVEEWTLGPNKLKITFREERRGRKNMKRQVFFCTQGPITLLCTSVSCGVNCWAICHSWFHMAASKCSLSAKNILKCWLNMVIGHVGLIAYKDPLQQATIISYGESGLKEQKTQFLNAVVLNLKLRTFSC